MYYGYRLPDVLSSSTTTATPADLTQEKVGGGKPVATHGRVTVSSLNTSWSEVGWETNSGGVTTGRGGEHAQERE